MVEQNKIKRSKEYSEGEYDVGEYSEKCYDVGEYGEKENGGGLDKEKNIRGNKEKNTQYDVKEYNEGGKRLLKNSILSDEMPLDFKSKYIMSIRNTDDFFDLSATKYLTFDKKYDSVYNKDGWFVGGKINACYNCVDRHCLKYGDKKALVYVSNEGEILSYTYNSLKKEINKYCEYIMSVVDITKMDAITIYMPNMPETVFAMLGCARLGIPHNVVFGGFSVDSLAMRIEETKSKIVVTVMKGRRGKNSINYFENVKNAVKLVKNIKVERILIYDQCEDIVESCVGETKVDKFYDIDLAGDNVPCVSVDSTHPLFYLYTSGSTGKPKGIAHSTAGYLLGSALSVSDVFCFGRSDVFFCTADLGWAAAHSLTLYGPLLVGGCTVIFGGMPLFPDNFIMLKIIDKCKVTHYSTAPTVVRMLQKVVKKEDLVGKNAYNMSRLKGIACMGEPLNKEAYAWFKNIFGSDKLPIIDTYWQTETGSVILAPENGVDCGPECVGVPFYGVEPFIAKKVEENENFNEFEIRDEKRIFSEIERQESEKQESKTLNQNLNEDKEIFVRAGVGEIGLLLLKGRFPSMAFTILNDHSRYLKYYTKYPGYYYTGDECYMDSKGYYHIVGRADDVINVSGHRLSTMQIESVVCSSEGVVEAAVVPMNDELTGQCIVAFVVKYDYSICEKIKECVKKTVRNTIGTLCNVRHVIICNELPKTRTGKIMRRVLKCLLNGECLGDITACGNLDSIEDIKMVIKNIKEV
ncbi:acetyl-coenzyme A synthetase [Hamiltosporidium tvaerminnensis]|uniref:acetate--CoA ligase n=1 Tax=Hamiltosporidium tvaerminnensis TaxID=1176355 RepID=A0A4Q9L789_9MICR|nr:acetyl-coenzyme A synthetase [Hamiltosporidium tvaerminnensis]